MQAATWLLVISAVGFVLGAPAAEQKLKFVTFVHRHGDRSPIGTYPTDPYGNESLWNNGWGELTNPGKRSPFALGKWLRERYNTFLPKIYNKNDYEVRSTDVRRTLMSAYLVLAGLYEPTGSDVWDSGIKWQPIPVHATPKPLDNVLASSKPCLRHSQLLAKLMVSDEILNRLKNYSPITSVVVKHAGLNSTGPLADFLFTCKVFDSLFVQNSTGLKIPKWADPYFPEPMKEMNSLYLRLPAYTKPLQRLYCGLLVKEILQHFKLKSKGLMKTKVWHYSAHDITIAGLRQCLGLNETEAPPYASALILELSSNPKEQHFVKILYKAGGQLKILSIPGCSENCSLEKFEDFVKPIIPDNWEEECKPIYQKGNN